MGTVMYLVSTNYCLSIVLTTDYYKLTDCWLSYPNRDLQCLPRAIYNVSPTVEDVNLYTMIYLQLVKIYYCILLWS